MIKTLPPLVRPEDADIASRLLSRTVRDEVTGCLLWTGAKIWTGYGTISVKKWAPAGRKAFHMRVHRVAYELFVGPIPAGMDLDHECHTKSDCTRRDQCPHRACLEPTHLTAMTHRENLLRGKGIPALNAAKTHCKRGHEFVEHLTIRQANGGRGCFICKAEYRADRRSRKSAQPAKEN